RPRLFGRFGLVLPGRASPGILALFPRRLLLPQGSRRMVEAPQRPPAPLTAFSRRVEVLQPTPRPSRLPPVGVVLAAGRSERLESVAGGGSQGRLRLGGR